MPTLEQDLPSLGVGLPAPTLRRFWMMLAHCHGQTWNSPELARSFGVAHTTVGRYLDVLSETFMVRQLQSWHENVGKRQIKAPKIYIRDSGLLHALLGLGTGRATESHPKVGASWEGFALRTVIAHIGAGPRSATSGAHMPVRRSICSSSAPVGELASSSSEQPRPP